MMECPICGSLFPGPGGRFTCSRSCGQQLRMRERGSRPCVDCGNDVLSNAINKPVVCTECKHERRLAHWRRKNARRDAIKRAQRPLVFVPIPRLEVALVTIKLKRPRPVRYCAKCVAPATGTRYCDACRPSERQARQQYKRTRYDRATVVSEPYTMAEIAKRDRYMCGLCRKRVAMTKVVPHHKAPTIDHVVPLSRGGDDTRANVQLAHFLCNSKKSDRGAPQQLALIG